jgi:glycosyltransferase involved in cell wall biosynthesis
MKQIGPMISVIIPTMNEAKYLGRLLDSIKNQTYQNYEVIVCDFKSSDSTTSIARKKGAIVITIREKGLSPARNAGISKAKGDILAFIDADIILSKKVFEDAVDKLRGNTVAALPRFTLDTTSVPTSKRNYYRFLLRVDNLWKKASLFTYTPRAYACVFCRHSAVQKIDLFNENLFSSEDLEFYNRLRKKGKFALLKSTAKINLRRILKQGLFMSGVIYFRSDLRVYFGSKKTKPLVPIR